MQSIFTNLQLDPVWNALSSAGETAVYGGRKVVLLLSDGLDYVGSTNIGKIIALALLVLISVAIIGTRWQHKAQLSETTKPIELPIPKAIIEPKKIDPIELPIPKVVPEPKKEDPITLFKQQADLVTLREKGDEFILRDSDKEIFVEKGSGFHVLKFWMMKMEMGLQTPISQGSIVTLPIMKVSMLKPNAKIINQQSIPLHLWIKTFDPTEKRTTIESPSDYLDYISKWSDAHKKP